MLHVNTHYVTSVSVGVIKKIVISKCCIKTLKCLIVSFYVENLSDSLIAIWRFLIGINTSYQYDEMQRSIIIDKLASCSQNSFTLC